MRRFLVTQSYKEHNATGQSTLMLHRSFTLKALTILTFQSSQFSYINSARATLPSSVQLFCNKAGNTCLHILKYTNKMKTSEIYSRYSNCTRPD